MLPTDGIFRDWGLGKLLDFATIFKIYGGRSHGLQIVKSVGLPDLLRLIDPGNFDFGGPKPRLLARLDDFLEVVFEKIVIFRDFLMASKNREKS